MDSISFQVPVWKYSAIIIILCIGDPDIIDGIVKVLISLSEWLLR
jgi:hypothetical protein